MPYDLLNVPALIAASSVGGNGRPKPSDFPQYPFPARDFSQNQSTAAGAKVNCEAFRSSRSVAFQSRHNIDQLTKEGFGQDTINRYETTRSKLCPLPRNEQNSCFAASEKEAHPQPGSLQTQ